MKGTHDNDIISPFLESVWTCRINSTPTLKLIIIIIFTFYHCRILITMYFPFFGCFRLEWGVV